ncbi:MAG: pyrroline-5-carboxylate reductase [Parvularculaceae bacterium]
MALVGAGSMGGALLRGWLSSGTIDPEKSSVVDPGADKSLKKLAYDTGLALNPDPAEIHADALVLAVKPQAAAAVLPAYKDVAKSAIVVSVMAGTSLTSLARMLSNPPRTARAMPNLPASIGAGVTGLYAPPTLNAPGREVVDRLMAAVGETVWVDSEKAIDIVTAVSGSGPAYYFLLTEALAEAGAALGLEKDAALKLARATAAGAGAMLSADPRAPGDMRKAVTSPGGTTAAALGVLDGDEKAVRKLLNAAVAAAAKRAGELTE